MMYGRSRGLLDLLTPWKVAKVLNNSVRGIESITFNLDSGFSSS